MQSQNIAFQYSAPTDPYYDRLCQLLSQNLDFHIESSQYSTHNFHSFPAKFPPQIPRLFIEGLTAPGDLILDPMQGSGTTIVEAILSGRRGVGLDIDPLASLIAKVKTTPLDPIKTLQTAHKMIQQVRENIYHHSSSLKQHLNSRWDPETRKFIDYWFDPDTQVELFALMQEIERTADLALRQFFKLAFSAIIITKSGGVSLARDLAHTRPHRSKVILRRNGEVLEGENILSTNPANLKHISKTLRSPIEEFQKRVENNVRGLLDSRKYPELSLIAFGNAMQLPLPKDCVDLIVTSPPYASNAIDYMRAHKFSLAWFGHSIAGLSSMRNKYIGNEAITIQAPQPLPKFTSAIIKKISELDAKKGRALERYFFEMSTVLKEMFRVLKPGKAAIMIIGSSVIRNQDIQTHTCLADIGTCLGFEVPKIGVRNLDRDRRMLPAGKEIDSSSQIQKRMHEEYVIGFYKPLGTTSRKS